MSRSLVAAAFVALLGCRAPSDPVPPRPETERSPARHEAAPVVDPLEVAVDPLDSAVAAMGYRVALRCAGPQPSLEREGQSILAHLGHAADGGEIQTVAITGSVQPHPMFSSRDVPLRDPAHEDARVVPLFARGEKRWFSVIETPSLTESEPRPRVRLVEVDATGRAVVRATHDLWLDPDGFRGPYMDAGNVAVVPLGPSVYALAGAVPLVLDGPGAELERFTAHSDPDCPPRKRCFQIPAEYSLPTLVGIAPDASFVLAVDGEITRVFARTKTVFRYQSYATSGVVGNEDVTLVHMGEPPRVVRWRPQPGSSGATPTLGRATALAEGDFRVLGEDAEGGVFVAGSDGALSRLTEAAATVVLAPPPGDRVTAAAAAGGRIVFVVSRTDPKGPTLHWIVAVEPPAAPPE